MNAKLKQAYDQGLKVVRVEAEDPEDVRQRDHAYIEQYVGHRWARRDDSGRSEAT